MSDKQKDSLAENKGAEKSMQEARTGGHSESAQTHEARDRSQGREKGIDFLLDVPLQVSVEVGRARMLIKDFLQMKEGGVIELDKLADEPLDLYVNSRLIARGEAVVVNEKFGLRLIDIVSPTERIEKLR
jgi:flagellar motor switch protein FliN/FliY